MLCHGLWFLLRAVGVSLGLNGGVFDLLRYAVVFLVALCFCVVCLGLRVVRVWCLPSVSRVFLVLRLSSCVLVGVVVLDLLRVIWVVV